MNSNGIIREEQIGPCRLILGDCLEVLPTLEPGSVDAVVTDPPYKDVLNESWDRQWNYDREFLAWCGNVLSLIVPAMANNGSLYWFASPRMASRVDVTIRERLNVLSNLVWCKGSERQGTAGSGIDVTGLRNYWPASERIVFAERFGSDDVAADGAGYVSACQSAKRLIVGEYLRAEFMRAGVTNKDIAALFPSRTGGLTGCVSNWILGENFPTAEQYDAMRSHLNSNGTGYLRREYEDLRREYEDLRRPFNLRIRDQWGDVWTFPIERNRIHPAQKPLALLMQMVNVSSRHCDVVCDPFMGSGTTGVACIKTGRQFVGIEIEPKYFDIAVKRCKAAWKLERSKLKFEPEPRMVQRELSGAES